MLHVLNGDATRLKLQSAPVAGTLAVWADALHDGPVPDGIPDDDLAVLRAHHAAERTGLSEREALETMRRWNAALAAYRDFGEVVFWLEHDLFDQLILLRHLHWLSTIATGTTRFSLICIGSYPGVEDFQGLGPLSPAQLATLPVARTPITTAQIALGRIGWSLFRSPDPLPLLDWMKEDLTGLPFLPGALLRHFEDYPWRQDGLSRSERQILTALADGKTTFAEIFTACARMEERIFMGDATFRGILVGLAQGRNPLVRLQGNEGPRHPAALRVVLTDLGEVVLGGGADHVELNGIDRWAGGVRLTTTSPWRWDPGAGRLVVGDR